MGQIARQSPTPAKADRFDAEFDIVVVGGGGVGLASALLLAPGSATRCSSSRRPTELGGTTLKAAFWYWVPNNEPMQAHGHRRQEGRLPPLHGAPVAPRGLRPEPSDASA